VKNIRRDGQDPHACYFFIGMHDISAGEHVNIGGIMSYRVIDGGTATRVRLDQA